MRTKKFLRAVMLILAAAFVSAIIMTAAGCGFLDMINKESESELRRQMSNTIVEKFKSGDRDGFAALFAESAREYEGFGAELDAIFDTLPVTEIGGAIIYPSSSGGATRENGKQTASFAYEEIALMTLTEKVYADDAENEWDYELVSSYYKVHYYWQIQKDDDTSQVGLHQLRLEHLNVRELTIGRHPTF